MDIDPKEYFNTVSDKDPNDIKHNIFDENEIQQIEKEENCNHTNSKIMDNMLLINENKINIISTQDEINFRRKLHVIKK